MARLAKLSLSPPCRWHIRLCTMLKQASLLVGVFVIDIFLLWLWEMFKLYLLCLYWFVCEGGGGLHRANLNEKV